MEQKNLNIRPAAAAGQFYPADADELKNKIEKYLAGAAVSSSSPRTIKAIMVPHAGYDYSGPAAAYAYNSLKGKRIGTAVIICNSHTAYFDGIAVDNSDVWQTPLGKVEVDKELTDKLVKADEIIKYNGKVHQADHALEVQLPFLQTVLGNNFKIAPILFGNTDVESYKKLAKVLAENLGENDIVIASSDMSHYPSYEDANKIDQETLEAIKTGDSAELENHIKEVEKRNIANEQTSLCGADGVKTVLEIYRLKNWSGVEVLKYANSGDAALGDKSQVVGYGAVVFFEVADNEKQTAVDLSQALAKQQQEILLDVARSAVENYVNENKIAEFNIADEKLNGKLGAFVTLRKNGQLRGCIGRIVPGDEPLWQVVRDMAIAAANEDDRFAPVGKDELKDLEYEISVLSVPEKIDDWRKIELGKHGVIARKGLQGGVFLPQVAMETGWDKEEFLSQLCSQKAGLPAACYKDGGTELKVFTAQVFH